jgi:hypothetical protein
MVMMLRLTWMATLLRIRGCAVPDPHREGNEGAQRGNRSKERCIPRISAGSLKNLILGTALLCGVASGQDQPGIVDPPAPQIAPARQEESCSYVDRCTERSPMRWECETPADCPLEKSRDIKGVVFTGRYANYTACDYWFPAWAADGHLYSACGDGEFCGHRILNLGLARIAGDDPLDLRFTYLGHFNVPDFRTSSAYGCTSLIKNGVWYLGLEEGWNSASAGTPEGLARFWGFLCGRGAHRGVGDLGYPFPHHDAWEDRTHHPLRLAAGNKAASQPGTSDAKHMGGFFGERPGINRFRNLHFVDFGRELEHSPDGKAYAVTHGSIGAKPAEWGNGDNVYLLRVEATSERISDPRAWQFFAGKNERGEPIWSDRIDDLKPLLSWEDRLGLAHVVYNAPLKKYLMWISPLLESDTYIMNEGPTDTFSAEGSLLLESAELSGPWRLVEYFHRLGPNAYCICFPSKFISPDGRSAWLLCSANYTNMQDPGKPAGMRYSAHFREVEFVMP